MAVRPICAYPEPVLRQKAQPVTSIDDDLQHLIDDMIETMYAAPGIGLAAPQIGVSLQLFVVDVTSGRDANALQIFINPEIVSRDGHTREDEGCLSVPGISGPTPRSERVVIRGTNREGLRCTARACRREPISTKWITCSACCFSIAWVWSDGI